MEAAALTPIPGGQDTGLQQPLVLKPEEAAHLLRVSRSQIYTLAKKGEIPSIKVGKAVRIPLAELVAWVNGGGEEAATAASRKAKLRQAERRVGASSSSWR